MQRHALKARRIQLMLHRQHALATITHRINLFALYHECADGTMPSILLVLRTIPPTLRTLPPNRPKWVHFCRSLPPIPRKNLRFRASKKAGQGRTPSGQMTQFLHFIPSEGALSSIWPHILTLHLSKHAKATQASHQNLGGYMCPNRYDDTGCDHQLDQIRLSFLHAETA